jgi:hypothetical protein
MTSDSGNGAPRWDQARIALGRVAELFNNNEHDSTTVEELRRVRDYELIPEEVRQTLEGLTPEERRFMKMLFKTLRRNHFYLEDDFGGLGIPY